MAASAHLSIIEYLNTTYEPDLEYVDGQLVERYLGKWEHGRIQALLAIWFGLHEDEWQIPRRQQRSGRVLPGGCASRMFFWLD